MYVSLLQVKGQLDWLKYFCIVMKTLHVQQKYNETQAEQVFSSKTDRETKSKREESEEMMALLAGYCRQNNIDKIQAFNAI